MKKWIAHVGRLLLAVWMGAALLPGAEAVRERTAMVTSDEALASAAGVEILRQGGNAVDAAVAVAFALAVTHPSAGNLGGGGFMLVRMKSGETALIDYRETAPAAARPDMYLDAKGELVPGLSTVGWKSAGIPGTVAGMEMVHRCFGRLEWRQVLAPAIRLARDGFPVSKRLAASLRDAENAALLGKFATSKRIFLRNGNFYRPRERFRQPELARTLERIAAKGAAEFYRGRTARILTERMRRTGGLITPADLAAYRPKWREPLRTSFGEFELILPPLPSSGGILIIEALNILEPIPLRENGWAVANIHLLTEVFRRVFADRAQYLGDSDFASVPVAMLLGRERAARWRETIDSDRATPSNVLRSLISRVQFDESPEAAAASDGQDEGRTSTKASRVPPRERSTTHFSIVDAEGNAVANTYTINDSYGSGATVPGLGFLLNNTMDDFTTKPGAPNVLFGLVQSDANKIEPGKRPLSAMTPTIILRRGQLWLVIGSPGGPKIITSVFTAIFARILLGLSLAEAIEHPRFHHQWMPDELMVERGGFPAEMLDALRARGHAIKELKPWGSVNAVEIDLETGDRIGVADPRRGGDAMGY